MLSPGAVLRRVLQRRKTFPASQAFLAKLAGFCRPYERRLRGAAPILCVTLERNKTTYRAAWLRSLDVADFFLTLVVLWLGVTLTFSIWIHGDGKRTLFFVWRKVLIRTQGFRVSRQARAQQSVAIPKLDVAPGGKSRTCFDT